MADAASVAGPSNAPAGAVSPPAPAAATATATIYINNLNEKVKLDIMKTSLESLFSTYGTVLSVTAHGNLRMRGQAFVAFEDAGIATRAVEEVNGFPLYGKAMQLAFAKTASDSVVRHAHGGSFDDSTYVAHKSARLAAKKVRKEEEKKEKKRAKKNKNKSSAAANSGLKRKRGDGTDAAAGTGADGPTAAKKAIPQIPDEYLPPNPILFIQNLPDEASGIMVTRDDLEQLFSRFEGLQDVRTIPNNRTIAFVEFNTAEAATKAREGLNGKKVEGEKGDQMEKGMRITFARG